MKKTPGLVEGIGSGGPAPLRGGPGLAAADGDGGDAGPAEAMELAVNEMDLPLCANACLVARAPGLCR